MLQKRVAKLFIICGMLFLTAGIITATYMNICFVIAGVFILAGVLINWKSRN